MPYTPRIGGLVFGRFKQSRCEEGPTRAGHQNLSNEIQISYCCRPQNRTKNTNSETSAKNWKISRMNTCKRQKVSKTFASHHNIFCQVFLCEFGEVFFHIILLQNATIHNIVTLLSTKTRLRLKSKLGAMPQVGIALLFFIFRSFLTMQQAFHERKKGRLFYAV